MEVMKKMEGAYALLIKSRHYPGEMVAAKRGSPMIVGIKEGSHAKNKSGGGLTHRCVKTDEQTVFSAKQPSCV
jgi:glucosamine 6-phosphate synthetase-like amidotransferase/phosphosugar isomerase protein